MKSRSAYVLGTLLSIGVLVSLARADIRLPAVVGDHMVLQRDLPLPIWGWADPGEEVTSRSAKPRPVKTDASGTSWRVTLPAMKSGKSLEMTLSEKTRSSSQTFYRRGLARLWPIEYAMVGPAIDQCSRRKSPRPTFPNPTVFSPVDSLGQAGQGR